jgi:AraC-like DNA-binding protein
MENMDKPLLTGRPLPDRLGAILNTNSRLFDLLGLRMVLSDGVRKGPAHAHAWPTVKIQLDGAAATWRSDAGNTVLAPGEALMMNAYEMHESLDRTSAPDRRMLVVMMAPEAVEQLVAPGPNAPDAERPFASGKVELSPALRVGAASLAGLLETGQTGDDAARDLARTLASGLLDAYGVPAAPRKGPALDFRVRHAIERARTAPEFFSVDDMIAISGLSRSRFFELFTAGLGLPPQAYLDSLLLFRAADALLYSKKPVASVGKELGFDVPDTFTRFVGRQLGLTPRAYRRIVSGRAA